MVPNNGGQGRAEGAVSYKWLATTLAAMISGSLGTTMYYGPTVDALETDPTARPDHFTRTEFNVERGEIMQFFWNHVDSASLDRQKNEERFAICQERLARLETWLPPVLR